MPTSDTVRFAVVGLGHIAQVAVLPGFAHAESAQLVALFSSDAAKRREMSAQYRVDHAYDYDEYDRVLERGLVDAVYIALPNHLHCEYAVRAAQRGIHVLVEKPMAVDATECLAMIEAAEDAGVKLMVAYRLHFDPANLEAIELVRRGRLGRPRLFSSVFSQVVVPGNVRLTTSDRGGGPVYDMGVYCINAARYLFRDEPTQVVALAASLDDPRFQRSPEMVGATLHFPGERLATFTCSFGAADSSRYEVLGDRGRLVMEPAFEYAEGLRYALHVRDAVPEVRRFGKHDQFGAQLQYFSECIIDDRAVEPDGLEGLADINVVQAIHRSAQERGAVAVLPVQRERRPEHAQAYALPPVPEPKTVNTRSPSGD